MELAALRYFLEVVDASSFAKLGLHASTLTRRVASLEDEVGVTFLERNHSGVRLTSGGISIMAEARRTLADLDALTHVALVEPFRRS
jgi:DNA-binding transcriptional LysR family regulator